MVDGCKGIRRTVSRYAAGIMAAGFVLVSMVMSPVASAQDAAWRYEVRPGDSLWAIAARYFRRIEDWQVVQRLNAIRDPRRLPPASTLEIPMSLLRPLEVAGTVLAVTGDVLRRQTGQAPGAAPVAVGEPVRSGESYVVGDEGSVTLEFADGSRVRLVEQAELEIERMHRFANTTVFDARVRLLRGRIQTSVVPKKAGNGRFEIVTPAAVTSVRGTRYRLHADVETSRAEVIEGRVNVGNDAGDVSLPAGFGTVVSRGEAPAPPVELLPGPDLDALPGLLELTPATLTFPPLPDAREYRVEIALEPEFVHVIQDTLSTEPVVAIDALADGEYFLRARGIGANGLEGRDTFRAFRLVERHAPPELHAPVDGEGFSGSSIDFWWGGTPGATHYRLEVSADPSFAREVLSVDPGDARHATVAVDSDASTLSWRVIAIVKGQTVTSEIRSVHRLPPPVSIEGGTVLAGNGVLAWQPIANADQYEVQLAGRQSFVPILRTWHVPEPSVDLSGQRPGVYFMRVRAIDAAGRSGSFGPTARVEVVEPPPAAPLLVSPAGDARLVASAGPIAFSWAGGGAAVSGYLFQIAREPHFSEVLVERDALPGDAYELIERLPAGHYFWRVAAVGQTRTGDFGEARALHVLPAPVTLHDQRQRAGAVTLRWRPVDGAARYRVEVATEAGFSSVEVARVVEATAVRLDGLGPGEYLARVGAEDASGLEGPFGPAARLVVERALLVRPEMPASAVNRWPAGSNVVLRWRPSVDAAAYRVQVAHDRAFARIVSEIEAPFDGVLDLGQSLPAGRYQWRVAAIGRWGESRYSDAAEVFVLPRAPAIDAPGEGRVVRERSTILAWHAVEGAVTYRVELSDTPDFANVVQRVDAVDATRFDMTMDLARRQVWWRVAAVGAGGQGPFSAISSVRRLPPPPMLQAVSESEGGRTRLAFSPIRPGQRACVMVATTPQFDHVALTDCDGGPERSLLLDRSRPWYVRARTIDADGLTGDFGEVAEIGTLEPPPSAVPRWWPGVPLGVFLLGL